MNQPEYLKGKSVFYISIIVIVVTFLAVYLTGLHLERSISSNFYISLTVIAFSFIVFLTYGLYKGIHVQDDFPSYKTWKKSKVINDGSFIPEVAFELSDLEGILGSILLWIGMTLLMILVFIFLEGFFLAFLFGILFMLYWIFFRALKLVFNKAQSTKGNLGSSFLLALGYTVLYTGWIYVVVYLAQILK